MKFAKKLPAMLLGGMIASAATQALADYPERTIQFLIGFSAGGGVDVAARTYIPYLETCLGGATFVYTYLPGAGGELAFTELAASEPDGYTLGIVNLPNLLTSPIVKTTRYSKDSYDYIGNVTIAHTTITVPIDSPYKTLDDFIAAAKEANPPLTLSIGGLGGDKHLVMLDFQRVTGIKLQYAPFGDDSSARNAIVGGHVVAGAVGASVVSGFQEQVRTLAVLSDERLEIMPEAPTFKEQSYDLAKYNHYQILAAPKGTPPEILGKLRECLATTMANAEMRAQAVTRGTTILYLDAEQTSSMIEDLDRGLRELWATTPWIAP